jgi:hypothetical protein
MSSTVALVAADEIDILTVQVGYSTGMEFQGQKARAMWRSRLDFVKVLALSLLVQWKSLEEYPRHPNAESGMQTTPCQNTEQRKFKMNLPQGG